ncbi:MAG: hypothetical protein IJL96_08640 [Clostridia bacterium]|nr:hypothetical protein [Clostridia bacterium]
MQNGILAIIGNAFDRISDGCSGANADLISCHFFLPILSECIISDFSNVWGDLYQFIFHQREIHLSAAE